jgi:hypothetical protein
MEKAAFIDSDPKVIAALAKLNSLRSESSSRWGEARRFAGKMAGNRLDKIERAQKSWGLAYDRAEARYNKLRANTSK